MVIKVKEKIRQFYRQVNYKLYQYRKKVNKNASVSLAYYLIISIVPICSLCAFLGSIFNVDLKPLESLLKEYLTPEFSNIITTSLKSKHISMSSIIALLISLYVVSKGINQMYMISKRLFEYRTNENFFIERIMMIFKTLVVFILLLAIIAILTFIPILNVFVNLSEIMMFDNLYIFLVFFVILILLYKIIPSIKVYWIDIIKGSAIASILMLILISILKYYFEISDYTTVYGPLASFVVIMITFLFVSEIIYIGMYVVASCYRKHKSKIQ